MPSATTDRIRFVLDGAVVELRDIDPTRTVLQFLREDLHRTGSKEGCAEGDCGACTIVLVELAGDESLRPIAVNACIQFLPTLDGKELLTVESLRGADGSLHPVQQAMVDCHGSQCGFCTPGFVMSMFALYKNASSPSRNDIDDALAGNLCRCTGYRPIVDAAFDMYKRAPGGDESWLRTVAGGSSAADEEQRIERLKSIRHSDTVALQHAGRRYFAPQTASELARLCGEHPAATLLAGGTDVGLWVTKQQRDLETVIYTGRVAELLEVTEADGLLSIGAAVPLADVLPRLTAHYPDMEELLLRFASPPIRNAGTLGGNVANGSPIGDSMPALLALDAGLVLCSSSGVRELPLAEFYLDYMQNALREGEFLQQLLVPLPKDGLQFRSYKVSKRFDQDISAVCAAIACELEAGIIKTARVAYGGLAAIPKRARHCEAALVGQAFNEQTVQAAMQAMDEDFSAISDMRASDEYRERVARNLLLRYYRDVTAALDGTQQPGIYRYGRG